MRAPLIESAMRHGGEIHVSNDGPWAGNVQGFTVAVFDSDGYLVGKGEGIALADAFAACEESIANPAEDVLGAFPFRLAQVHTASWAELLAMQDEQERE